MIAQLRLMANLAQEPTIAAAAIAAQRHRRWADAMALLICSAPPDEPVDWRNRVAYLGQAFYAQLVAACWRNPAFPCLSAIADLDYGEELAIRPESLSSLLHELVSLPTSTAVDDVKALRGAGEHAKAAGTTLWIAGDMHPVITRQ